MGAQFGTGLLWTLLNSYPLMAAIQEICARMGRVTGLAVTFEKTTSAHSWLDRVRWLTKSRTTHVAGAEVGGSGLCPIEPLTTKGDGQFALYSFNCWEI